jgi:hypothetical protein
MPRDDRRDLPFLGVLKLKDPEAFRELIDWPHANTRKLDRVEEALIAQAIHAGQRWTSYSRRRGWYTSPARRYLPRDFGYRPMVDAVGRLEAFGSLEHDRKRPQSVIVPVPRYQSRFRASPNLLRVIATKPPSMTYRPRRSAIVLRDAEGHLTDFTENAWTRAVARNIAVIEEGLASICIGLDGHTPCLSRSGDYLEVSDRNGDAYSIHIAHIPVCRVFNGAWDKGGRFAGPPYQSWPQKIRSHITIDSEPTGELDFGQTHARMLCARAGLEIDPGDLFDLPGFERDFVKAVFHILLNALTLQSALRAAAEGKPKGTHQKAGAVTETLKERYPALTRFLHTGIGLELMRLESDIAEDIQLNLNRRGIVALPIHDSYITKARHTGQVEEAMADAWAKFVGSKATVSQKQKSKVSAPLNRNVPTTAGVVGAGVVPSFRSRSSVGVGSAFLASFSPPLRSGVFFDERRHLTKIGRLAILDAKRRRDIRQDELARLAAVSRPALANILAGRFGTSPEVAERIARIVLTTPAHERQPFLPGLAA